MAKVDKTENKETIVEKNLRQECARNLETDGFALDDFTFNYTSELENNLSDYGLYFDTELINYICKEYQIMESDKMCVRFKK